MQEKPLHLEQWGNGKPLQLVMFAQAIAVGADSALEGCKLARAGELVNSAGGLPSVREWYALYRNHRRMAEVAPERLLRVDLDEKVSVRGADRIGGYQALRELYQAKSPAELAKEGPEGLERAMREAEAIEQAVYRSHLKSLRREIAGGVPGSRAKAEELRDSPEMLFFMRVFFPCWLEYGVPLTRLLRRARGGRMDAIEKLLRLDKGAREDPRIREDYHQAVAERNEGRLRRYHAAMRGHPLRNLTRRKMKLALGALVYKVFAGLDSAFRAGEKDMRKAGLQVKMPEVRLKVPEVQALFDAAAKDFGRGLRDEDLPRDVHTFDVGMRRELKFWPDFAESHISPF